MFDEEWPRFVVKMATGAGKTKVLSLLMAWSYFHKLYESDSTLSRNFLLIAPNIIVLDRLRADFDGLRIFFNDPVLPDNGHAGRNWRDDFQIALHIQDDVRVVRPTGNLFLTNIHRVYLGEVPEPSLDDDDLRDYFLSPFGDTPVGKTTDSNTDLGELIREIDELAVFNDEAHHIHDPRMAWFKCIQDIHHRMLQKDLRMSIQIDVSATPKANNGAIFVQTISDYPLVEAIAQNVVKHPVLPDAVSRAKLTEHKSPIVSEKYADYLALGVEEWRKSYAEHEKLGKKAVLFVMVDDTKNCDEVGAYLEKVCPDLQGAVLVIHTKANGEISEASSGKSKEELELLRKQSNEIDTWKSPYKAIVSVLMLKEGWDVRNVSVIVGLRAYSAKSNILPEQTLGRGLRRMYFGSEQRETVSVMGTPAFMDFVESIQSEGVNFERVPMGGNGGKERQDSLVVEVETRERLVAEQQNRVSGEGLRHPEALLLTTGEVADGPIGERSRADLLEQLGDVGLLGARGYRQAEAMPVHAEGHEVPPAQRGSRLHQLLLRDVPDTGIAEAHGHPVDRDRAAVELLLAEDCPQQTRLARPVRAEHREKLARLHAQI